MRLQEEVGRQRVCTNCCLLSFFYFLSLSGLHSSLFPKPSLTLSFSLSLSISLIYRTTARPVRASMFPLETRAPPVENPSMWPTMPIKYGPTPFNIKPHPHFPTLSTQLLPFFSFLQNSFPLPFFLNFFFGLVMSLLCYCLVQES